MTQRRSINRAWAAVLPVALVLAVAWSGASALAVSADRTTCSRADYGNERLFGPKRLPNAGPLGAMLRGYRRFAGMTASAFMTTWFDREVPPQGTWRYPSDDGYLLTPSGNPVRMVVTLFPGVQVDRFGREARGRFLAPTGTPYAARALPPQSLDSLSDPASCNYLNFVVLKRLKVRSGPIAFGFGQPGFGYQYVLDHVLLRGSPKNLDILYLTTHGYLKRIAPQAVRTG